MPSVSSPPSQSPTARPRRPLPTSNPNSNSISSNPSAPIINTTAPSTTKPLLKPRALILSIGIFIIAGAGAIIGASLRQETQRSNFFSRFSFSTFTSAQAIAGSVDHDSSISSNTDTPTGGIKSELKEVTAEVEVEDSSIVAQIQALERKRAAFVRQKLIIEKKMEGLRERQREKEERDAVRRGEPQR